jgi:hypothetical protein
MSRLRIFIVTYRNAPDLHNNLASLFASDAAGAEVTVINNHSDFSLADEFAGRVRVLHNVLRPDSSTGHLSRNWNQAIMLGFGSLSAPQADYVVHCQDDVVFDKNWWSYVRGMHERYSFVTMGLGDAFCSYAPDAVRKIGLWDERFCNIGYQEGDYFLRALVYNRDRSSINDPIHGRMLNADPHNYFMFGGPNGSVRWGGNSKVLSIPVRNTNRQTAHDQSVAFHGLSSSLFREKWGVSATNWMAEFLLDPPRRSRIQNYITYPYFERDVEDLGGKNYLEAK